MRILSQSQKADRWTGMRILSQSQKTDRWASMRILSQSQKASVDGERVPQTWGLMGVKGGWGEWGVEKRFCITTLTSVLWQDWGRVISTPMLLDCNRITLFQDNNYF